MFGRHHQGNTFHAFASILFGLAMLGAFLHLNSYTDLERCYFYRARHLKAIKSLHGNVTMLEDLMEARDQPMAESGIFFIDASCHRNNKLKHSTGWQLSLVNLTLRQACAVESAARINNDTDIFVLFASPAYLAGTETPEAIRAISSYDNVKLRYVNPWSVTKGTPYEKWFQKGELFKCKFPEKALTDFLRMMVLYRWGGSYIDFDTLALRPVPQFANYISNEADSYVSTAFMGFGITSIGHRFTELCLQEFKWILDDDQHWHTTGRDLLTAVRHDLCHKHTNVCVSIKLLDEKYFAPVGEVQVETLFTNLYINRLINKLHEIKPYGIYLWHCFTSKCKSSLDNPGIYGLLAAKNCPKVYSLAKDYF